MMKKNKFRKLVTATIVATMALGLLAGCTSKTTKNDNEQKVVRIGVMYGSSDDSYFRQQYTDLFEYSNKNVTFEIVPAIDYTSYQFSESKQREMPDNYESIKKLMTGDNPVDIIIADTSSLKRLVQENMLKQLDPLMQEDKFDTSDIVPAVLGGLKDIGDGKIYGLTPSFSSSALFYNKKVFSDAGVEVPKDNMTWDEIFATATRLAKGEGKERTFGFSFNSYGGNSYWSMQNVYLSPLQLKTFDDKAETMTVNSPQWKKSWEAIVKLLNDKVIPTDQDISNDDSTWTPISNDLFLQGRLGMLVGDTNYINQIDNANKNAVGQVKDFKAVDWDVVTVPTHAEKPDIGGNMYLSNVFAINSSAPNAETAWEFIKFVNGEDFAKLRSRSGSSYEMVSRKSFIKPKQGLDYNIEAFFKLKPVPPMNSTLEKMFVDKPGLNQVNDGNRYFQQVVEKKLSVEEALKKWTEEGNKMLIELKNNPKVQFQEDGTPYVPNETGSEG
jgi:multiple sugar transport system substrate-binding protein